MIKAQIFRSAKRVFDCIELDTKIPIKATASKSLMKASHPVVGDIVLIDQSQMIVEIQERKSQIWRKIIRENKIKVMAANVDCLIIQSAVSKPDYKSNLIDRYLVRSIQWQITPIIILNKMDEFNDQFDLDFEKRKYQRLGVEVFFTSAVSDQFQEEIERLKQFIANKTSVLVGQSGVGKSQLINKLSEGRVNLESKELAKKILKGAHTTTWAELIDCGNFNLMDSPGVRSLSVNDISIEELDSYFPDLDFHRCKFNNCQHEEKSKGCYFSTINDPIIMTRLSSYKKIRDDVRSLSEWEKN